MAKRIFTEEQTAAITERNKTLLVAAAAGSGKTATLTERIIRSLSDPSHPADLSRMLVVTFTRAAARELRERIGQALETALAEKSKDRHLRRQMLLLPNARIETVSAYCMSLVRSGASLLGISPGFRVADEAEALLLAREVMEDTVEEFYAADLSDEAHAFTRLVDDLADVREEGSLSEILLSLSYELQNFPEGADRLLSYIALYESALKENVYTPPYLTAIRTEAGEMLSHYLAAYRTLLSPLSEENSPYFALALSECEAIRALMDTAKDAAYTPLRAAFLHYDFQRLPTVRGRARTAAEERFYEIRKSFRDDYRNFCKQNLAYTEEYQRLSAVRTLASTRTLHTVMSRFFSRFSAEKRKRSICDFSDAERFALSLLRDAEGNPTPFAEEVRRAYDDIYIDEYQDISPVQHAIFTAIARENNLFMVGDVKQSIYSFRHADSAIFTSMKNTFPLYSPNDSSPCGVIYMSKNFRSDDVVLSFANAVFDRMFGVAGEEVGYRSDDRLSHGKSGSEQGIPVTVAAFPGRRSAPETPEDIEALDDGVEEEARYIAEEIRRLLRDGTLNSGAPIRPSDIAILFRKGRSNIAAFAASLRKYGVPVTAEEERDFFYSPEILLVLSLLHVIDNPRRDIYLAGVLRSPLYGLTMDDLVEIRLSAERGDSLYDACLRYKEKGTNPRLEFFLSELSELRRMAEGLPTYRLIHDLYQRTGMMVLAENRKGSKSARKNLLLLYHYARSFEKTSFRGLYRFLSYVDELIREGKTIPKDKPVGGDSEAVTLMTIHASKGLEFPVCFVADTGKRLRFTGKNPLPFDRDLGVALSFRDESGLALADNPVRRAVLASTHRREMEEEMRILYVALTRARERLYVTGSTPGNSHIETLLAAAEQKREHYSPYAVRSSASHMEMLLAALPGSAPYYRMLFPERGEEASLPPSVLPPKEESLFVADDAIAALLRERFSYTYSHAAAANIPGKLSVSRLYPAAMDEEELPLFLAEEETLSLPRFMGNDAPDPARRGTATHLFMQFCDFHRLYSEGTDAEIDRLTSLRFITPADGALIFRKETEAFRTSHLLSELLYAPRIYRELRFHAYMPASAFSLDEERKRALQGEKLLVQGVIDCVYFRPDGSYVLVDYKTDRLSQAELAERTLAEKKLLSRHAEQLSYYARAASSIFGAPPAEILIYSLPLADTISVSPLPLLYPEP